MSSRNREKRSRTPSSEANSSFVKNVTSRVSGLLPATITKWFSSPSTSSANGSAPVADPTDSSTDDETLEPPPSKRLRFSSGQNSFFANQDVNSAPPDILEPSSPYPIIESPPSRNTFRRDQNFESTPLAPNDVKSAERAEDSTMFRHLTVSAIRPSVATKRKSLFDSESSNDASIRACAKTSCNTMRDPNQPAFKASLLASPFYPGRTMYGGASASYINEANIKQRKNTIVNKSNAADNSISHSTRRVMDLLEQYSSPMNDAKRISQYLSSPASGGSVSTLNSSRQSNKLASYKTQELHVPSIAAVLRLKRRGRLMDTTAAARQIIASHSSTSNYHEFIPARKPADPVELGSEAQGNLTSKVKTKLTRPSRRKSNDGMDEMPVPVSLPTAVLQIDQDKLPKFSFEAPKTSAPTSVYTLTETSTKVTETKKVTKIIETDTEISICKPDTVPTNPFTFASPVRISSDAVNHDSQLPKFTFGSPERKVETKTNKSSVDSSCVVGKESAVRDKDWKCSDCWVLNKPAVDKCVCCGGQKPSDKDKLKKCSMCKLSDSQATSDKCVNCEKIKINNVSKPLAQKTDDTKWKCSDCWVSNEEAAKKCVCCGACNPKKPAKASNESDSDWKCDDCWIKNKGSVDKCAACGGAKPGAKSVKQNALTTPPNTSFNFGIKTKPASDTTLTNIVKSQSSKWECPNCLVRNEAHKTKCACCESDKPGTIKEPEKKFNFGVNTSFKFGIDPKPQEAKPTETKPEENKAVPVENKKEEQSETNNNILPKTPMFSFGVAAKKPEDESDGTKTVKEKSDSAPKLNFSFGVPTSAAKPDAKPPETKVSKEEKPQEVPTVTFTLQKPKEIPKTVPSFTFGTSVSQPAQKPAVTPVTVLGTKLESKEAPANTLVSTPSQSQPATTTATQPAFSFGSITPQQNFFTPAATSTPIVFGSSAITSKPITFGAPTPTPSTTAPTITVPMFQPPATTTANALSMFQKPETTTSSLFQKTEAAVTTAAPTPLFSFGTNTQPAVTEKPKFNFTFGSNKTESTPIFGAPTDSSSNKFTLPTGNALSGNTGGNGLTGNALGNAGLGNTLGSTTSGLGVNPIPNALGGNGLSNSITGGVLGSNSLQTDTLGSSCEPSNPLAGNMATPSTGGIFGSAMPKENMWSSSNSTNVVNNPFVSNTTANTNSLQKPAAFTFGTSTPFNSSGATPAFGSPQTVPNVFGMNQPSNQSSLFSSPPASNVFGAPASSAPVMFGAPTAAAPAFGPPSASMATFEAPRPSPAFNFSAQQQPNTVFGFGQQQQPQQTPGVYNFGATGPSPQVQFNMGSSPNTAVRRVRKAVRKNPTR